MVAKKSLSFTYKVMGFELTIIIQKQDLDVRIARCMYHPPDVQSSQGNKQDVSYQERNAKIASFCRCVHLQ